jgi:hypothetical protein
MRYTYPPYKLGNISRREDKRSASTNLSMTNIITDPAAYEAWYHTPRGAWIGGLESALLLRLLQPHPGQTLLDVGSIA